MMVIYVIFTLKLASKQIENKNNSNNVNNSDFCLVSFELIALTFV